MPWLRNLALGTGQGVLAASVLAAAIYAPRSGEPAVLLPLAAQPLAQALAFAETERTPLMQIDSTTGRLVVLAPDTPGLLRAIASGFVPIATTQAGCAARELRKSA
ncbi:MAG TPA: hypothetical protein VLA50_09640 [Erythrobacter sp.]|nr:hypothetical protein [Erythrobacter sp.]